MIYAILAQAPYRPHGPTAVMECGCLVLALLIAAAIVVLVHK